MAKEYYCTEQKFMSSITKRNKLSFQQNNGEFNKYRQDKDQYNIEEDYKNY